MIEPEPQAVVFQVCTVDWCDGMFWSGDVIGVGDSCVVIWSSRRQVCVCTIRLLRDMGTGYWVSQDGRNCCAVICAEQAWTSPACCVSFPFAELVVFVMQVACKMKIDCIFSAACMHDCHNSSFGSSVRNSGVGLWLLDALLAEAKKDAHCALQSVDIVGLNLMC